MLLFYTVPKKPIKNFDNKPLVDVFWMILSSRDLLPPITPCTPSSGAGICFYISVALELFSVYVFAC